MHLAHGMAIYATEEKGDRGTPGEGTWSQKCRRPVLKTKLDVELVCGMIVFH